MKTQRRKPMISFDHETCRNLDLALRKEWLETNGLGGFASSTITGLNTRRYHGLLTAATRPPVGRMVLLSKLEEALVIAGRRYELSANLYPGVIHPQGHQYLKEFRLDPFPVFTYEVQGIEIEKSVFTVHGENSTVIQYQLRPANDVLAKEFLLEVYPLIAFRDFHSTTHENGALNRHIEVEAASVTVRPYDGLPAMHLAHNGVEFEATGHWYRNFQYEIERERGLNFNEDLFNPCVLKFEFRHHSQAAIIASTERRDVASVDEYRQGELKRRAAVIAALPGENQFVSTLVTAADQFIVARGEQKTVIAGYHWFGDWG